MRMERARRFADEQCLFANTKPGDLILASFPGLPDDIGPDSGRFFSSPRWRRRMGATSGI